MKTTSYDSEFYENQQDGSLHSAREVVPFVLDLFPVKSVADVGGGLGTWASVFTQNGVPDVMVYDGDYVRREMLKVPVEGFTAVNLEQHLDVGRKFDLAVCLEVGEHLPARVASTLVRSLAGLSPVVMFSAAIPLQGGTHHINEQWPSYWANLFLREGFLPVDAIRARIWQNRNIEAHYRQNILFFVQQDQLANYPKLLEAQSQSQLSVLDVVHPEIFRGRNFYPLASGSHLLRWAMRTVASEWKRRFSNFNM